MSRRDYDTRDDRIVGFYYPILSCFWKIISVSDPIRILFLLKPYYPYPKTIWEFILMHNIYFLFCVYFALWGNITAGVIFTLAEHDWLK